MPVTQQTHWKTTGTEPTTGVDDEYVVNGQPIAEHDNWINYYLVDDITNTLTALQNTTTGHAHDGVDSKTVNASDVINTPAGDIVATDVQAAITELDTEKIAASSGSYTGNDTVNRAIPHGLGRTPTMVRMRKTAGGAWFDTIRSGYIGWFNHLGSGSVTVTAADATNFYIGNASSYYNSANDSGIVHYWVAIG